MANAGMPLARIVGTGSYVPEKILTNADLERLVDTSDEWITARTGIRERHVAAAEEATSDLAVEASRRALDAAGVKPAEVDLVVCATVTPDTLFPSTACIIQDRLGLRAAAAMDLSAACSGFIYGIHLLRGLIATGAARRVLLIGAECLSKITNYEDRSTCVLFGDGAGAAVLVPENGGRRGVLASRIGSDGSAGEMLCQPAGGSRIPATVDSVQRKLHTIHMKGNEVFKMAVRGMEDVTRGVMQDAAIAASDIDLVIPHQANLRMIQALGDRLEVPPERVYVNIDRYGNTSAASVPIALDEVVRAGRLRPDQLLVMVAFGGGLTWGALAVRW
ncbi:MAG TPA: beta-ketoacyl-ACP synthase III [Candidatus Saccharimonadales bacterium]|nr:beta-ketoacyl-ACP synthase III [Candidatus Saccharimonadales bacterium]